MEYYQLVRKNCIKFVDSPYDTSTNEEIKVEKKSCRTVHVSPFMFKNVNTAHTYEQDHSYILDDWSR